MSDPHHGKQFPSSILYGAGALVVTSMLLTLGSRLTGVGTVTVPEASAVRVEEVRFEDQGSEGIRVIDAETGTLLARTSPGQDGFVRGVLRGMLRTRKLEGMDRNGAFRMTQWSDGRLSLTDMLTDRRVELRGFGATNLEAFAKLFAALDEPAHP